jgi:hypothetical protein
MPNSIVSKVAQVCNKSVDRVEHLWDKAKSITRDRLKQQGTDVPDDESKNSNTEFYAYVMGVFKHMLTKDNVKKLEWQFPDNWTTSSSSLTELLNKTGVVCDQRYDDYLAYSDNSNSNSNSNTYMSNSFSILPSMEVQDVVDLADTNTKKTGEVSIRETDNGKVTATSFPIDAQFWLPMAAKHYNISPDLNDYILMPVPAMISDIPNTKGDSVSKSELLDFKPMTGTLAYKTFKGKPAFLEHDDSDIMAAKGVILDVYLRPLRGFAGNRLAKMIELIAFDKTKDPRLCHDIESGRINTVSIGMIYTSYSCSMCGGNVGPNHGSMCQHTNLKRRTYIDTETNRLVYRHCHNIHGKETSAVRDPAYVSAIGHIL